MMNSVCLRISVPAHRLWSGTWARGSSPCSGPLAICPATNTKSSQTTAGTNPEVADAVTPLGYTLRISYSALGTTAISEVEMPHSAPKQLSMTTEVLGGM